MIGKLKALGAGFVLGLLVAPRAGRESRRILMDWINEFFESGSLRFRELEEELGGRREEHEEHEEHETLP